jgi:hypothetical protein
LNRQARSSFDALAVVSVESPDGSKRYYETTRMNPLPGERDGEWATHPLRDTAPALPPSG